MVLLLAIHSVAAVAQDTQSPDYVKSTELNATAVALFNQGKFEQALPLATQSLELRTKVLGPEHSELIPLLTFLGQIYKRINVQQSAAHFRRALKLAEKSYGSNDIRLLSILDQLAFVEYTLKNTDSAEDLWERSLKIKQSALAPQDPSVAETAFNLGQAYTSRNNYKRAAPMFSRAISIWEASGEKDRPQLQKALESYVVVLTALGKNDEAAKAQHRLGELSSQEAIVNGGILNTKALVLVTPLYPSVRGVHPSGTVQVQVFIDENGHVLTAKAQRSKLPVEFERAAENAARQCRFSPAFVGGKPVKVNGIIIFDFVGR
jgi:TonB family protein